MFRVYTWSISPVRPASYKVLKCNYFQATHTTPTPPPPPQKKPTVQHRLYAQVQISRSAVEVLLQLLHYVVMAEDKMYGYFLLLHKGAGRNFTCFFVIGRLEWDYLVFVRYRDTGKAKIYIR